VVQKYFCFLGSLPQLPTSPRCVDQDKSFRSRQSTRSCHDQHNFDTFSSTWQVSSLTHRLVGSFKLQVSFAEETCKRDEVSCLTHATGQTVFPMKKNCHGQLVVFFQNKKSETQARRRRCFVRFFGHFCGVVVSQKKQCFQMDKK